MTSIGFSSLTTPSSYWQASRAPRYSLLFALPLLLFYQTLAVSLSHGARSVRNGADVILQSLFVALAGSWGPLLFMLCLIGGERHVGRPGLAADAGAAADAGSRLVDAAHGVAGRGDLRGALVPGGPGRRARDCLPRAVRLAPHHGRRGRHARRRGDLLRLPLYRPVRRPAAALLVPVPDDRGRVLLGALPGARVRDHGVDARTIRRVTTAAQ